MSALADEIREAVRVALADLLPPVVEGAVMHAAQRLQIGDSGDELLDAEAAGRLLGMKAPALRRAEERGRAPVAAIRIESTSKQSKKPSGDGSEPAKPPGPPRPRLRWRRRDILAFLAQAAQADAGAEAGR